MPRIIRIVFRPQDEWPRIAAERGHGAMLYAILLSLIPAAASFDSDLRMPESAVLATYLASLLAVFAVAAAFWLLVKLDSRDESLRRCIQVAAYGATPLFLASASLVTPVLVIVCVAAAPYVFYLYWLGAQQLLGVPRRQAPQFVAVALVAALASLALL